MCPNYLPIHVEFTNMSQIGLDFLVMVPFVGVPLRMLLEGHPGLASSKSAPIHGWTYHGTWGQSAALKFSAFDAAVAAPLEF